MLRLLLPPASRRTEEEPCYRRHHGLAPRAATGGRGQQSPSSTPVTAPELSLDAGMETTWAPRQ